MVSLPGLFLPLFLASAGAPGALEEALASAQAEARLPLSFAAAVAPRIGLAFHHREEWSPAFFVPAAGASPPRLVLYAPYYLAGVGLGPLVELRVDTADYLFHSLALAYLELEAPLRASPCEELMARRAGALFPEVPIEQRLDAYRDAGASFVAHAMAVAIELHRKEGEWRSRGRSLCPEGGAGLPLFVLWERIFEQEPYRGRYFAAVAGEHSESRALWYSRNALAREDKEALAAALWGGFWSGGAAEDFAHFCGSR